MLALFPRRASPKGSAGRVPQHRPTFVRPSQPLLRQALHTSAAVHATPAAPFKGSPHKKKQFMRKNKDKELTTRLAKKVPTKFEPETLPLFADVPVEDDTVPDDMEEEPEFQDPTEFGEDLNEDDDDELSPEFLAAESRKAKIKAAYRERTEQQLKKTQDSIGSFRSTVLNLHKQTGKPISELTKDMPDLDPKAAEAHATKDAQDKLVRITERLKNLPREFIQPHIAHYLDQYPLPAEPTTASVDKAQKPAAKAAKPAPSTTPAADKPKILADDAVKAALNTQGTQSAEELYQTMANHPAAVAEAKLEAVLKRSVVDSITSSERQAAAQAILESQKDAETLLAHLNFGEIEKVKIPEPGPGAEEYDELTDVRQNLVTQIAQTKLKKAKLEQYLALLGKAPTIGSLRAELEQMEHHINTERISDNKSDEEIVNLHKGVVASHAQYIRTQLEAADEAQRKFDSISDKDTQRRLVLQNKVLWPESWKLDMVAQYRKRIAEVEGELNNLYFFHDEALPAFSSWLKGGTQKLLPPEEQKKMDELLAPMRELIAEQRKFEAGRAQAAKQKTSSASTTAQQMADEAALRARQAAKINGLYPQGSKEVHLFRRLFIERDYNDILRIIEGRLPLPPTVGRVIKPSVKGQPPHELTAEQMYIDSSEPLDKIFAEGAIHRYIKFNEKDLKRYLPEGFGRLLNKREFESTSSKSILIRPQIRKAIKSLKTAEENAFVRRLSAPPVFYGNKGCGKSAMLPLLVFWARRNNWLVVYIPNGEEWVNSGDYIEKSPQSTAERSLWDQPQQAYRFFNNLLDAHADKLKLISIKTKFTLGKLEAKTLFDVVEFGAALIQFSSQAFAYFREELYRVTEFPVLIAADDYNAFYNGSETFKDPESQRYYKESLPARNLTMTDAFIDGHKKPKLAYGTYAFSITNSLPTKNFGYEVEPFKSPNQWIEVPPYSRDEFDVVMRHYQLSKWVMAKPSIASRTYIYSLTSGFGSDLWDYTKKM